MAIFTKGSPTELTSTEKHIRSFLTDLVLHRRIVVFIHSLEKPYILYDPLLVKVSEIVWIRSQSSMFVLHFLDRMRIKNIIKAISLREAAEIKVDRKQIKGEWQSRVE